MKPPLGADSDMVQRARQYIEAQFAIMERHGSRPELSEERMEKLLADVLKPMIAVRKQRAILEGGEK